MNIQVACLRTLKRTQRTTNVFTSCDREGPYTGALGTISIHLRCCMRKQDLQGRRGFFQEPARTSKDNHGSLLRNSSSRLLS